MAQSHDASHRVDARHFDIAKIQTGIGIACAQNRPVVRRFWEHQDRGGVIGTIDVNEAP